MLLGQNITGQQLKCFLEVAKDLSFTKAAKNLFTSQSNISRQIFVLEDILGVKLFERSTRSVKLTVQGQILYGTLCEMKSKWKFMTRCMKDAECFQTDGIERSQKSKVI